jgi:hypothetical protein
MLRATLGAALVLPAMPGSVLAQEAAPACGLGLRLHTQRTACELLGGLDNKQWSDVFRAGGDDPAVADRFIRKLHATIAEGLQVAAATGARSERR